MFKVHPVTSSLKKVTRSLKITRLGFRKIVNSLITDPTNNGDKINDKTWDFTLEQPRIAKNDIDFMNAGNIILGNNWKKVGNWKWKNKKIWKLKAESANYGSSIIISNNCLLLCCCFFAVIWNTISKINVSRQNVY